MAGFGHLSVLTGLGEGSGDAKHAVANRHQLGPSVGLSATAWEQGGEEGVLLEALTVAALITSGELVKSPKALCFL